MVKIRKHHKLKKGLTLVESAIAIAIGVVIVALSVSFFMTASTNQSINETHTDVMSIKDAIDVSYTNVPVYSNLNNARLVNTGTVPSKLLNGSTMMNTFGGAINVSSGNYAGGSRNVMNIEFRLLPDNVCSKVATMRYGKKLVRIRINGTNITLPANTTDTLSACNREPNNIIIFSFL